MTEDPVFPMFIYIYDTDGRYGEPVQINSEAQLHGPGTKMMLKIAMEQGVEIRITDPGDLMLFHAHHGRILFGGGAKQRDSVGCFHQLEHIDEPPFRYRCKLCGKKLKIASGVYPPKKERYKMNRWQRLARQRQEERLITPYDPLCICGAASSEHEPASGDPFDGTPHVCKRTGCAGFKRSVNGSSGYPFNRNGKGKP